MKLYIGESQGVGEWLFAREKAKRVGERFTQAISSREAQGVYEQEDTVFNEISITNSHKNACVSSLRSLDEKSQL